MRSRWPLPLWVVVLTLATGFVTGIVNAKGPPTPPLRRGEDHNHQAHKFSATSTKDDLKDFQFTQTAYNASVRENSLGSTLILPYTDQQVIGSGKNPSSAPQKKMGVWNPSKKQVLYSIVDGDSYNMFRAEALQIGDFNFLLLRVRNNDRILNREFKELYKLQVKAELLEKVHVERFDNTSLSRAFPLLGEGALVVSSLEDETNQNQTPPPTTTEKQFIISEDVLSIRRDMGANAVDVSLLEDPFSLQFTEDLRTSSASSNLAKKNKRRTKQKREKHEGEPVTSDIFSVELAKPVKRRGKKEENGPLKRILRDEKLKSSLNGTRPTRPNKGRGSSGSSGRRRGNKARLGSQEVGINEIRVDQVIKSVTVRTTSNNVPNYKKITTTTTESTTTSTTTTRKPAKMISQNTESDREMVLTSAETTVFVRVTDVDDNQPVFESQTYDIGVNEDAPVLSKVAKISAADADIGRNSEIYYSLAEWNDAWSIDPITGVLSPTRPLLGRSKDRDRETIRVRAKNRWNSAPNSGSVASVNIHVRPVNRYAPQIRINRPPQVEVRPYGVIYAVVSIRDPDEGENGVVDLEIKEGDPNGIFRVTPTSSRNEFYVEMSPIVANNLGKGERLHQFNLTLRAVDRGTPQKSSEKELQVRVADTLWLEKATNSAIFDKDVYEVEVSETSPPHSVVFRLKRPDSAVGLSISSGNEGEDFVLEEKSGVLYTNKWLDADLKSTYTLTIDSHDRRPSQRTGDFYRRRQSVAKIIVKVLDGNDNSPEWEPLPNNRSVFTVMENESVGTKVVRIVAKDRDSGENGYVTYSIANLKPTPFTIDHFSGDIRTGRLLDYEIDRRHFSLKIRASDWGQPARRQSEKTITILLADVNDNRPLFTVKECVSIIDRGIKFETEIGRVEAIDFDREEMVTYRIVGGNEDGCFAIDSLTGKIKVVCDLRDIRVPKRFINVTATDGEYYSDIMSIKIELGEGRMTNLKVNRSDSGGVRTGIKLFSTSNSVLECDIDTGVQERFDRMAALSEKNNQFEDSEEGFPPLPSRYRDNVHTPQFVDVPKEISVFENTTVGTTVMRLLARDLDKGYNGLLTFVISSGDEAHGAWDIVNLTPSLGEDSGEAQLVVAAPLDRENVASYILNISVWDQGNPSKVSSKLLYITVRDSNDCTPTFTKSAMKLKVGEGSELVGEQLVGVTAYDEDEEGSPNSLVSYKFLTPSPDFVIDEKLGTIRLLHELDRERKDSYELLIVAEDHGFPKLSSIAIVSIIVEDRNDGAPKFESFTLSTSNIGGSTSNLGSNSNSRMVGVMEDWPVGGVVTQVVARDDDLGLGGKVRYSLGGDEEDFSLDEMSGVLRVKTRLDYETTSIYNLTIRAHDLGTPSLSSETFIVIEVLDVLESSASISFSDIAKETTVPETIAVGSQIARVELVPSEAAESIATLALEGPSRYLFTIDHAGIVRTAHALDYEHMPTHWLTVLAKSSLTGKTLAKMDLFVNVTDSNECVPLTNQPAYRVFLPENTPAGVVFLKLFAFDCDPGGRLTWSLKTSTPYFDIDPFTGELETTDIVLDREKKPVHIFDITVSDSGSPPLNSTSQVVVVLQDENDNAPKFLHKRGIHTIPELPIELQGDQPLHKKKNDESRDNSEISEEVDDDEDEEESEDDEDLKWSDWNVIENHDGMFSEGGGWKKIFQVVAFDNDEGSNGSVTYRLKYRVSTNVNQEVTAAAPQPHKEDEVYSINPTTGEIFTSAPFIKSDTMLKFIVEATDGGFPNAQATENTLILRVKAVSRLKSQPPQILLQDETVVQLTTKERAGYTVETIDAIDVDSEQLWYEIVSGDPDQYFIMWPESQNLILAKRIPTPMDFKLNISVSDGMNPAFVQPMTRRLLRAIDNQVVHNEHDFLQILEPGKNCVVTKSSQDEVQLGRKVIQTVGLIDTTEWFCCVDYDNSLLSTPHFLLSRLASSVFIEDLDSREGTFLNGKKLDVNKKVRMSDGDFVSLGISHLDPLCDLRDAKYFVFRVVIRNTKYSLNEIQMHNQGPREIVKANEVFDETVDQVFGNHLVVSQIISFFNVLELKELRLVNNMWADLISKKMSKEGVLLFKSPKSSDAILMQQWNNDFQLKTELVKTRKIKNIKVDLEYCSSYKVFKDLDWLFHHFGKQLSFLHLKMDLSSIQEVSLFLNVIQKAQDLRELGLELFVSKRVKKITLPAPIENVRLLHLHCFNPSIDSPNRNIIFEIMKVFPTTTTLSLNVQDFRDTATEDGAVTMPLENLEKLKLAAFSDADSDVMFLTHLRTNCENGLKILEVKDMKVRQSLLDALGMALVNHAPSLEALSLEYSYCTDIYQNLELTVPKFPNLKKLQINVNGSLGFRGLGLIMEWIFQTNIYSQDFPVLKEMQLGWTPEESAFIADLDDIFDNFVPPDIDNETECRCFSMQKVELRIPKEYPLKCELEERAKKVYPNAVVTCDLK